MQAPKTRQELEELIVEIIDSDFVDADDVASLAIKIEAQGVSFVPTALLPAGFINPYALKKGP